MAARLLRKLSMLLHRKQLLHDLDEEMAQHRAEVESEYLSAGMSPQSARTAAMRRFGNTAKLKDQNQQTIGFSIETLLQDVRYAIRQLVANPSFAIVIIVTLALSIGANSAIFSVINGVLIKSLPYAEPQRLVRLFLTSPEYPKFPLNPFDFRDFRAQNHSFQSMAAFSRRDMQLSGSGDAQRLYGFAITAGYFHVLGVTPQLGREFDQPAEVSGSAAQVILSDRLWRKTFAAAPDIIGRKITLNAQPFTVIGIMPARFQHPGNDYHPLPYGESIDVWSPFQFEGDPSQRGSHFIEGIARLKENVTNTNAESEMDALMAQLARQHPSDLNWRVLVVPLYKEVVGPSQRMLFVLLAAVAMVLLIACANAANLLLARSATRQREIAVRMALGAPRRRLVRQLLTESLLISLLGGLSGLALAFAGVRLLISLLPASFPRAHDIHVSAPVFAFTCILSLLTGILFGLAPAFQAARSDPRQGLQKGARGATAGSHQKRLRNALVISEVSLACILLIGAGLMCRSLLNLIHLDAGFQKQNVLTATLSLPHARYPDAAAVNTFYEQLLTAISSDPGVQSVGLGSDLPWTGYDENMGGFNIEGKQPPPHQEFHARYHFATPDYFRALGTPLVAGRFFTGSDRDQAPSVLIMNHAMATAYWPHENVIGQRLAFTDHPKDAKDWITIVGVVGDVKDQPNSRNTGAAFWVPEAQQGEPLMSLVVRTNADPLLLSNVIRTQVARLDPALAVADLRVINQIADESIATPRLTFALVALFAALAIVLAIIGIYGVISYAVSQRSSEFGLRMALGAQRADVLRLVLRQAGALILSGTILGVAIALSLSRLLQNLIYQVSPYDPPTFVLTGVTVILAAMLACYIPARRATRAEPMTILRAE